MEPVAPLAAVLIGQTFHRGVGELDRETYRTEQARRPGLGRRVRVLATADALSEPVWYTGIVMRTRPGGFQLQMKGVSPTWFSSKEQWFYAEPLFGKPRTPSRRP